MLTLFARTALIWVFAFAPGCHLIDPTPPLPTHDGPENVRLLDDVHGTMIVFEKWSRTRKAYHFDGAAKESSERYQSAGGGTGWSRVPDRDGRVAYSEYHVPLFGVGESSHSVHWRTWPDGEEHTLARPDGWLSDLAVALSRRGGKVAYPNTESVDSTTWRLSLRITEIESGSTRSYPIQGANIDVAQWLPDDRRLVYLKHLLPADVPPGLRNRELELKAANSGRDPWTPIVCVLDTETGVESLLWSSGRTFKVCGENAIAIQQEDGCIFIDATDGHVVRPFRRIPGIHKQWGSSLFAAIDLDRVIYNALPTTGTKPRFRVGDMLLHEALNPIKLADLRDGSFVTLVQYAWEPRAYFLDYIPQPSPDGVATCALP